MSWRRLLGLATLCLALSSTLGCNRSPGDSLYPVTGSVFDANNRPASGALVIFHPRESRSGSTERPLAYVNDQGKFALTTYEKEDGAAAGDYTITIEWRQPPPNPFAGDREGQDRLQGKYNDPQTSDLSYQVLPQENVVPSIRLE